MATVIRKSDARLWVRLTSARRTLGGKELKTGWFSTNHYEDGTPVAYVATIHEFGAVKQGIPPRPFMRPTVEREENNWRRTIAQESKKIILGSQTVENLLKMLGLNISAEIARSIFDVTSPPLLEATIRAKVRKMGDKKTVGSLDKPLVETSVMLDSVTYTVGNTDAVSDVAGSD